MEENKNNFQSEMMGFDSVERGNGAIPEEVASAEPTVLQPEAEVTKPFLEDSDIVVNEGREEKTLTNNSPEYRSYIPPVQKDYREGEYHYSFKKPKKNKSKYGVGTVLAASLLAAVIGAGAALSTMFLMPNSTDDIVSSQTSENKVVNTTISVDKVASNVVEAVAEKSSASVVGIRTTAAVVSFFGGVSDNTGEGSGVIYSSDGYIITNYHVLESVIGQTSQNAKIEVFLNNDTEVSYPATVVGYNISSDLAVIKIDKTGLPAIEIADSDELKSGQFAVAIGCPGGLDFIGSVSYGIISGLDRTISSSANQSVSLIQTDAAINPGNSGGALLNTEGQLIGINSSKIASTEYEGMGFAIPSNTVAEICNQIIAKQDDPEPYIGITISETYSEATLKSLGYPTGAVVSSVVSGGPASDAGIRRGDIITEFDGKEISSYNALYDAIMNCTVGKNAEITVYRSGRYYQTEILVLSNNAQ